MYEIPEWFPLVASWLGIADLALLALLLILVIVRKFSEL